MTRTSSNDMAVETESTLTLHLKGRQNWVWGMKLKLCRMAANLTQQQVADHFGVNRSTINNMENCGRRSHSVQLRDLEELYKQPKGTFG